MSPALRIPSLNIQIIPVYPTNLVGIQKHPKFKMELSIIAIPQGLVICSNLNIPNMLLFD